MICKIIIIDWVFLYFTIWIKVAYVPSLSAGCQNGWMKTARKDCIIIKMWHFSTTCLLWFVRLFAVDDFLFVLFTCFCCCFECLCWLFFCCRCCCCPLWVFCLFVCLYVCLSFGCCFCPRLLKTWKVNQFGKADKREVYSAHLCEFHCVRKFIYLLFQFSVLSFYCPRAFLFC